jgi:hypothetical protein
MNARKKLNSIHISGGLLVAGVAAIATGSWTVFLISAAVILTLGCYSGDIRLRRRDK